MSIRPSVSSSNKAHTITSAQPYGHLNEIYLPAQNDAREETQQKFNLLPSEIKNKIYALVYDLADRPKTSEHSWGRIHAFDAMPRLQQAIHLIAVKEFDALTTAQKGDVESEVYRIAGSPKTSDKRWGKNHAKENTSILLQSMERSSIKIILKNWVAGDRNRGKAEEKILAFLNDQSADELDLSNHKLKDLPDIFQYKEFSTRLESLNLSKNRIKKVAPEIGGLQALRILDLSSNQIRELPPEISRLQALEILYLSSNQIEEVPPEIGGLQALRTLRLDSNQIEEVPPEIGGLQALETLDLSSNQIRVVPPEIGGLQALETLDLSSNQIRVVPPEIGSLQTLEILDLNSNQIEEVAPEIGGLQALETLDLSSNLIRVVPPEIGGLQALETLYFNSNQIEEVPPEIGGLQALRTLRLDSNQLAGLPQEVLNLPNRCEVELTRSGLSPAVLERLRAAATAPGYQGPRISFSMEGDEQRDDGKTIQESLDELFATTGQTPREFPNLLGEPVNAANLRSWLSRLSSMRDYKREGNLNDVVANKILGYLVLAEEEENFRNTFYGVIQGAAATCGDRMALSVLHLGIAHRRTTIDLKNMKDLAKFLIKGPWAIGQLEMAAREKIPALQFFDEIEVYLAYPIRLKNRLELQIDVDEMLYFGCSALTPEDLNDAACFIEDQLSAENGAYNILVEDDTWVKALTVNYPKEIQAIEEDREKATEEAETADDYLGVERKFKESMVSLTKRALTSNRTKTSKRL